MRMWWMGHEDPDCTGRWLHMVVRLKFGKKKISGYTCSKCGAHYPMCKQAKDAFTMWSITERDLREARTRFEGKWRRES